MPTSRNGKIHTRGDHMTDGPKQPLWTKDFIFISSVNFFLTLVFYLLMMTIAVYATTAFNATISQAGLAAGIFIIGVLIGRLVTGGYIDQIGAKKVLLVGIFTVVITTLFYFFFNSLTLLIINRFLHGLTFGVTVTATNVIVAQIIPDNRRGEGVGFYSLSVSLAAAVGPFLGMHFSKTADFTTIFILSNILVLCSLLMALVVKTPPKRHPDKQQQAKQGFALSHFIELKTIPIAIIMMIAGFAYSSVMTYLTFYALEIELVKAASFFFIVYAAIILFSRPFTGRLFDLKGPNIIIYPALLFYSLGLVILSQAQSGLFLLVAAAILGLGFGNFQSSAQAFAVKLAPSHRIGIATSTFFIFLDIGYGLGPYILGYIVPYTGYRGLYLLMGGVAFFCMILYYFLLGKSSAVSDQKATAHM